MTFIEAEAAIGWCGATVPMACRLQIVAMAVISAVAAIMERSRILRSWQEGSGPRPCGRRTGRSNGVDAVRAEYWQSDAAALCFAAQATGGLQKTGAKVKEDGPCLKGWPMPARRQLPSRGRSSRADGSDADGWG